MAIDTLDKRGSAHRAANPWARICPEADGDITAADRAHAAGYYGGLLSGDDVVLVAAARDILPMTDIVNILGSN